MNQAAADGGGGGGTPTVHGEHGGADGEGLIDPYQFVLHHWDIDLEGTMEAGKAFTRIGTRILERSETLTTSWAPLAGPGVWVTPESEQVHALMEPAVAAGESVSESSSTAGAVLTGFWLVLVLKNVRGRLETLEEEAHAFREEALAGVEPPPNAGPISRLLDVLDGPEETVPWHENPAWVNDNNDLLQRYAEILEDISEAAVNAAAQIEEIEGMPDLPDVEPYDADAIMQTPMPWGSGRDIPWGPEAQIVIGAGKTIKDVAVSLAALAGWDGSSIWPSASVAGNSWKNLGNSVLGLVAVGVRNKLGGGYADEDDIQALLDSDDPLERYLGTLLRDGQNLVLPLAGGGTSVDLEEAAERWKNRPWEIGTETALAWAMLFLPGPKTKGVPLSPRASSFLDEMIRASDLVQTGSGWYTKGGIRVADAAGRWLGDQIYGGSGGKPGGSHMWHPGDPTPDGAGPGGKHKPGEHRAD